MKKTTIYTHNKAKRLLDLLHVNHIEYDLKYRSYNDQRDGRSSEWVFTYDTDALVDMILSTLQ